MMAIFFTKYAVGVVLARQLPCALEAKFIGAISLSYGCLGGLFLARYVGDLALCKAKSPSPYPLPPGERVLQPSPFDRRGKGEGDNSLK